MNSSVDRLRWGIYKLDASVRQNVDQMLVEASRRIKKMFVCEAMASLQGVQDHFCNAAGDVQKPSSRASAVVNKSLRLIVGHSKHDKVATQEGIVLRFLRTMSKDRVVRRLLPIVTVLL